MKRAAARQGIHQRADPVQVGSAPAQDHIQGKPRVGFGKGLQHPAGGVRRIEKPEADENAFDGFSVAVPVQAGEPGPEQGVSGP